MGLPSFATSLTFYTQPFKVPLQLRMVLLARLVMCNSVPYLTVHTVNFGK